MRFAAIFLALVAIGVGASTIDGARAMVAEPDRAAQATAKTPPGLLLTVVSRDGVVNPGNTSTVTALCGRTQAAVSWGFTTISFPASGGFNNALLRAVVPIVRANGLVAGWIATFTNPTAVPLSVRLQATCARAQGGLKLRGTGERPLQAAEGVRQELVFQLFKDEGVVEPGGKKELFGFCPFGSIPLAVAFELGDLQVTELSPISELLEFGIEVQLENLTSEPQPYVVWLLCASGSSPDTVVIGQGVTTPRAGQLALQTGTYKTVVVGGASPDAVGSSLVCGNGANLGLGYRVPENAMPQVKDILLPRTGASAHAAKPGTDSKFDVRKRFIYVVPAGPTAVTLELVYACLKSAKVKIFPNGEVRLRF